MTFIELRPFANAWRGLGLSDLDLQALQARIMADAEAAPVVPGTGRLRKLRFAPASWKRGRSGATRVCYAHFPACGVAVLVTIYPKSRKDDLTEVEKRTIRRLLASIEKELESDWRMLRR